MLQREVAKNVSPRFFSAQPLTQWTAQLAMLLPTLAGLTVHQARREYVKICVGCRGYGLTLYRARQMHLPPETRAPSYVLLGVGVDGVSVRDPTDLRCIERYRFSKLRSWGVVSAAAGRSNPEIGHRQSATMCSTCRVGLRVLPDSAHHTLNRHEVFFDLMPPAPTASTGAVVVEESAETAAAEMCILLHEYGIFLAAKRLRQTQPQHHLRRTKP